MRLVTKVDKTDNLTNCDKVRGLIGRISGDFLLRTVLEDKHPSMLVDMNSLA